MTGVVDHEGSRAVQVTIGVDTHQDRHVAVAVDRHAVHEVVDKDKTVGTAAEGLA